MKRKKNIKKRPVVPRRSHLIWIGTGSVKFRKKPFERNFLLSKITFQKINLTRTFLKYLFDLY